MESDSNVEVNTNIEEIIKNIQLARDKLEKSSFLTEFMEQMQNPEMVARIERVLGTDPEHSQFQIVLYGVGAMKPNKENPDVEPNHMQLCLAILLRENFEWVHDIVVYDPILSTMEEEAINAFDCNCLSFNENCRRTVNRPTLFFMPHCEIRLIDNVLEANWSLGNLNKIIILGNSLKGYDLDKEYIEYHRFTKKIKVILDSDHMLHEMPLPQRAISLDGARHCSIELLYYMSFHHLSWHFFDWDGSLHGFKRQEPEMLARNYVEIKKEVEEIGHKIRLARKQLKKSSFYRKFMEQMQDPEMVTRIKKVIGTDPHHSKLQVVLHGIVATNPNHHMLIAFAILLRKKFDWVNDIVVYDPSVLKILQRKVLSKALDCSFFSESKHGRWSVDRPTLFFMPGSQMFQYYVNILEANWTPALLNKFIILGQSFKDFSLQFCSRERNAILNNEQILHEMPLPQTAIKIPCADIQQDGSTPPNKDFSIDLDPDAEHMKSFNGLCWHFFGWDSLLDGIDRKDVQMFLAFGGLISAKRIIVKNS